MNLLVLMTMQSIKNEGEKKRQRQGLARQAGMQACSLSEFKDPPSPPWSSHLQVEWEKTLLSAGLFSGTLCIQPSIKVKVLTNLFTIQTFD